MVGMLPWTTSSSSKPLPWALVSPSSSLLALHHIHLKAAASQIPFIEPCCCLPPPASPLNELQIITARGGRSRLQGRACCGYRRLLKQVFNQLPWKQPSQATFLLARPFGGSLGGELHSLMPSLMLSQSSPKAGLAAKAGGCSPTPCSSLSTKELMLKWTLPGNKPCP